MFGPSQLTVESFAATLQGLAGANAAIQSHDIVAATPVLFDTANDEAQRFQTRYQQEYKASPGWLATFGYDAALAVLAGSDGKEPLKGITGVVFVELNGGDPAAKTLLEVTPENDMPEIPSEKTGLNAMLDELPKLVRKFSAIEDQVKKVVTSVSGLTEKVKENPSLLLRRPKESKQEVDSGVKR